MHWLRWQCLLAAAFVFRTCYCAEIPNSIVLIVPVNNSIILNEGKPNILITFGLNETTTPNQTGYSRNTTFSFTYPNGTVLYGGGEFDMCRIGPGGAIFSWFVDAAGVYVVTANVTYVLPESGANCSTGPYSYQSEIVSAAFNVLPAQGTGSNGTLTIVTKTYTSQPTGSVQSSTATKSDLGSAAIPWMILVALMSAIMVIFGS